jgi:molybdopterin molybdotransferase
MSAGPASLRSIEEALVLVLDGLEPLAPERVGIAQAAGRIAAEPVRAAVDLPPFDRSAMDGYAVRAADIAPGVPLRLAGGVAAGDAGTTELEPGSAMEISTGAAIPPGADSVLQSEHAEPGDGTVTPQRPVPVGCHVRRRGEDVSAGDPLVAPGERLTLPRWRCFAGRRSRCW